jgi:NADH dehydrogenase
MDALEFDVVIAGGGFAGVYCAKSLARELGRESAKRVALVADENFMVFQPMLAEVTGSSISPRHVINPIRRLCRDVTVLRGKIDSIQLDERLITLDAGDYTNNVPIRYRHLAIAIGSVIDLSRVPGMPEHAFLMKNVGDALQLRGTIIDRFEEANLQRDIPTMRRLLTFVVVGGGYSGVETAGQIQDLVEDSVKFYPRLSLENVRVILIHSGPHLLPEISESLGRYCEENLASRGVELVLNGRVNAMTSSRVILADGRTFESHTVVSTVGNAPHPLLVNLCREANIDSVKGRLLTDPCMRVVGREHLWAAGDCAAIPIGNEKFSPPTAQFAMRQGRLLGRNLALALIDREPEPFTFTGLGELAAIGHRAAVADIMGLRFSGFFAWFLWRTIYLSKLPGIERKLRVMIDWTLDLFFPRDIALLRPRTTKVMQEMHLESGDQVFRQGEPAFSFYIIKSGRIDLFDANGLVRSLGKGEHLGERALLQDKIWRFTAVAMEPSTLVVLSEEVFGAIASASESIREFFAESAHKYVTREQIESLVATVPEAAKSMRAEQLMTRNVVTMQEEMTVADALKIMTQHPYNSYPLEAGGNGAIGFLTQDAIYEALKRGRVTQASTLREFTVLHAPTIHGDTSVPEAMERFYRSGSHKLLVTSDDGKLLGILSLVDLMAPKNLR